MYFFYVRLHIIYFQKVLITEKFCYVSEMPSTPRPRGSGGGPHGSPRTSTVAPMSERQQMALLIQMTSQSNQTSSKSVHHSSRTRERNERGETPLHVASIKGDQEQVKKLLDRGVDPNVTDFAGWTPLHEACSHGWYHVVVLLVKAGADVNAKGLDGDTPLHDAAISGQLKLVKYLIEHGADPKVKNRKGKLPADVGTTSIHNFLVKDTGNNQRTSQGARARDENSKKPSNANSSSNTDVGTKPVNMEGITQGSEPFDSKENPTASDKHNAPTSDSKDDSHSQLSSTVVSTDETTSTGSKRAFFEGDSAEHDSNEDDTSKRKKRKDNEPKEVIAKPPPPSRVNSGRGVLAGTKPPGPASKTGAAPLNKSGNGSSNGSKSGGNTASNKNNGIQGSKGANASSGPNKSGSSGQGHQGKASGSGKGGLSVANSQSSKDRKSPCVSPKPSHSKDNNETDEDTKAQESSGPKVPPLKIVIPGGVGASGSGNQQEGEGGSGQRGSGKGRGMSSTLPYVIPFTPGEGSSNDHDGTDNGKDDKKHGNGHDEKTATTGQRVLRSHRTNDGDKDKDKERTSPHSTPVSPNAQAALSSTKSPPPSHGSHSNQDDNSGSAGGSGNQANSGSSHSSSTSVTELHPRKRKIKASKDNHSSDSNMAGSSSSDSTSHSHAHTHSNPYQMYLHIRKQIERRQKSLFPVQPKPPQGFRGYLMNKCTYVLQRNVKPDPIINAPPTIPLQMREEYAAQEKERHKLRIQHLVEKEKLVLAVEQEILRVHGRAARALANQSLPFSVCTLLRDKEVYNVLTPEQEEKERNAQRSRYNGRLFISWLQDVDDKWEKIKEGMVKRHHMEAESLHAIQSMSWEWKLKELGLCEYKTTPHIDMAHVPMVHVSDDFDLLPE